MTEEEVIAKETGTATDSNNIIEMTNRLIKVMGSIGVRITINLSKL
jgi:hypothetical protein